MSTNDNYIKSLEERITRLASENSRLSLLNEMFKNFEKAKGLEDIINTIINDALSLHGGQNVILYYQINNKWYFKDLLGQESGIEIEDYPDLVQVVMKKDYIELKNNPDEDEYSVNLGNRNIQTATSYIPLIVDEDVIAILVLKSRILYSQFNLSDFDTFFNYAGIVLKNAIQNYSKLDQVNVEFEQIYQSINNAIILLNNDNIIQRENKAASNLFGTSENEIVGKDIKNVAELVPILKELENLNAANYDHVETDILLTTKKDNNCIDCLVGISKLRDSTKKITGTIINIKDISDRKKAEQSLKESEERFSLAVKGANDGIWDWNLQTNEIYYSPRWKEMLGYDEKEIENLFSEWEKLVDDKGKEKAWNNLREVIDGNKERYEVEFKMKHKDGYDIDILSRAFLMLDNDNKALRLIGTHTDLSELKKKEQELKKALEKAEESEKLKTAFLANMSHEIRTPMNGILGFSEMLLSDNINDEKRKFYAKIVVDSAYQLLSIVNDILDISIIDAGEIRLDIDEVKLNDLLNYLNDFFDNQAKSASIRLEAEKSLPDNQCIILTDKTRLLQILTNLMNNAFKFTNEGCIRFGYTLEKINKKRYVQFFVQDTGIGIPEDMHKKIFERFRQGEQDLNRQYGGTGLGLAISQKLTKLLGGDIWVDSKPGKGTTFIFTIPYKTKSIKDKTGDHVNANVDSKEFSILIVEDEETNFLYIKEILKKQKYKILRAYDGIEAIELCSKRSDIVLVLMDIKLPFVDGYEATKKIKSNKPNLPIIAQTAFASPDYEMKAHEAGCDNYISKPIAKIELLGMLEKYIRIKNN